jgi:hypothetical protein
LWLDLTTIKTKKRLEKIIHIISALMFTFSTSALPNARHVAAYTSEAPAATAVDENGPTNPDANVVAGTAWIAAAAT